MFFISIISLVHTFLNIDKRWIANGEKSIWDYRIGGHGPKFGTEPRGEWAEGFGL